MAIALVASASGVSVAGDDAALTFDSTGANFIVVATVDLNTSTNLSDNKSNVSWNARTVQTNGSSVRIFDHTNPTVGSSHTITIDSNGGFPAIFAMAFSGVKTTAPFDQQNGATGSGTTLATGSVTPSENNEVVVAFVGSNSNPNWSINGGFTIPTDGSRTNEGANFAGAIAYLIQTSLAAANPTFDGGVGVTLNAAAIATYKEAGAGGTTIAPGLGSAPHTGRVPGLGFAINMPDTP